MARCKFRSVFVAIRLYFEVECNIQPVLLSILYILNIYLTQTKRLPGSVQNCLFSTVIFGMTSLADEFVILGTDDVRR